jgi:hypothetical protein
MNRLLLTSGFNRGIAKSMLIAMLIMVFAGCGEQKSKPVAVGPLNPPNWGQRKVVAYDDLKTGFSNPDMIYAPFIFWFWDEPLNPDKMAEMSRVMGSQGFSPGYAHARNSMVGTPDLPSDQWLGEKWFGSFSAALTEAEKQKNYLGYCDEYWWPSFQANGRVLKQHPELKAESLNWQTIDAAEGTEVKVPASYFAVAAQLAEPIAAPPPQAKFGKWIWNPDAKEIKHRCWFRNTFEIPAGRTVKHATLRITADNELILFVNGKKTAESIDWDKPVTADVTSLLKAGKNLLAVECNNRDGKFGLIAGLMITLDDGTVLEIKTDKSWMTSPVSIKDWEIDGMENFTTWVPAKEFGNPGDNPWTVINNAEPYIPAIILSKSLQIIGSGDAFAWKVPAGGMWRIYTFNKYSQSGVDGGAVNSIDNRLAGAFIKIALDPYVTRLGDKLGKSIPGDFIDHEGDYGRKLAWSNTLDSCYKDRYGSDIRLLLPLMVNTDAEGKYAKARWEWFDMVSDLYAANFRALTDWHEQRGMYTTAHVWEEGIPMQVSTVGDHMKILRSVTMPGQDCLGAKALQVHDFKEIESVAEFQNSRATTELMGAGVFGNAGNGSGQAMPWGTFNPSFLKQAVNAVTAWGMSHIIPHGVFTTRKLTGNPWPPDWYSENPMFPWMHIWTDFVRRTSYVNSMGSLAPDVLLYNPMESAWINTHAGMLDNGVWDILEGKNDGNRTQLINTSYCDAINDLTDARIEFLVGDRYYLNQMKVKKGTLVLRDFVFTTIVLPPLDILTLDAARKILDFTKAGGQVYSLGELPSASAENGMNDPKMKKMMDQLKSQATFTACSENLKSMLEKGSAGLVSRVSFNSGSFPMLQQHRRIDGKDFFWLVNNNEKAEACELTVTGVKGAASIWNCETGSITPVTSSDTENGSKISLTFKPLEAYWVVFDPELPTNSVAVPSAPTSVLTLAGTWKVTFNAGIQPVMEFPSAPPSSFTAGLEKPLEDWKIWGFEKFSGLMDYTKTINIEKVEKEMFIDLGKVCHVAEVWVNGQSVGSRMWGPYVFDISSSIKPGRNEIKIRIANLINNSYTDIQESGLMGPVQIMARSK